LGDVQVSQTAQTGFIASQPHAQNGIEIASQSEISQASGRGDFATTLQTQASSSASKRYFSVERNFSSLSISRFSHGKGSFSDCSSARSEGFLLTDNGMISLTIQQVRRSHDISFIFQ
jgi:hypothetical protein